MVCLKLIEIQRSYSHYRLLWQCIQNPKFLAATLFSVGVGHWDWCPPPQPTRRSEERRELHQWGPGRNPGRQCIFGIFQAHRTAHEKLNFSLKNHSIDGLGAMATGHKPLGLKYFWSQLFADRKIKWHYSSIFLFSIKISIFTLPDGHHCGSATHSANKIYVEVINSKL